MMWIIYGSLKKGDGAGGRFRSVIPSRMAGDDLGCDRWRGGKGEDPEAADHRDNAKKMRARWDFGNIKKSAA